MLSDKNEPRESCNIWNPNSICYNALPSSNHGTFWDGVLSKG